MATVDGVFAVDRKQRIAFWNDSARNILGFDSATVLGRPCYEVLRARDDSGCAFCKERCPTFHASLRGKFSPTTNVKFEAIDGTSKDLNVTTFVLPSEYRELFLLAHVFRETGETKESPGQVDRVLAEVAPRDGRGDLPRPTHTPLTARETQVLNMLASGASTMSICRQLGIKTTTVRTHAQHILDKLGVHSRLEAVAFASRHGLLGSNNHARCDRS